jgi:uncharacterized protein
LLRAPETLHRVLALDVLVVVVIAVLTTLSCVRDVSCYIDAALALALLSFSVTLVAARYVTRGGPAAPQEPVRGELTGLLCRRYCHAISRIVEDNPGRGRYELRVDDELVGWAEYRPAGDSVIVEHTEIDQRWEGQGLGSVLVRGALDLIRTSGKTVIPSCEFTAAYIGRHPEYVELVDPSVRDRFASST